MRFSSLILFVLLAAAWLTACRNSEDTSPDLSVGGKIRKKSLLAAPDLKVVLYETEYFYGPDDKLIRTTSYSFSGGQSRKQEYSENQYDQEGNLATSTLYALQAAGTFGVQATTTYTWQSGLLRREQTSHVGGPGSTISYDYQDGRLTEKTGSGMNGQKENSVVYLYDDPGKLIRETHLSAAGKKVSYAVIA